ncbi:MAG: hypothetical protein R3C01_03995 [Planctomycetaceae bacterium]
MVSASCGTPAAWGGVSATAAIGGSLSNPQTWLAASEADILQSVGRLRDHVNYASYLKRNDDVVLSGLTSTSMNEFFEVCLGGLITLPAAFMFIGPVLLSKYAGSTFSLGFIALPGVFDKMPGGQFFGFIWFFMLFLAAITSSISMLQPVIAFFEEGFGLKRHASAAILGMLTAGGTGFVVYFSKETLALDTLDFWIGTFLIYVLAMLQTFVYGWIFGIERGEAEAHVGAHIRIPRAVQYLLKYVTPVYLLVIFVAFCWTNLPGKIDEILAKPVALASVIFIGVLLVFLMVLVRIAGIRWAKEGRYDRVDAQGELLEEGV